MSKYAIFVDGKYWDTYPSREAANRAKKTLHGLFKQSKIMVRKVTA